MRWEKLVLHLKSEWNCGTWGCVHSPYFTSLHFGPLMAYNGSNFVQDFTLLINQADPFSFAGFGAIMCMSLSVLGAGWSVPLSVLSCSVNESLSP